jgi:hypothetical protein
VLTGDVEPDYTTPVAISTTAAQKELISLALLGVVTPVVVGMALRIEALGGPLAGAILSGQLLAVFMNNAGVHGITPRRSSKMNLPIRKTTLAKALNGTWRVSSVTRLEIQ